MIHPHKAALAPPAPAQDRARGFFFLFVSQTKSHSPQGLLSGGSVE